MKTKVLEINGQPVAQVKVADSFMTRFRGLMLRSADDVHYALALKPCSQIHTFFMTFELDVAFVGKGGNVISTHKNIRPWRVAGAGGAAHAAIEAPAGTSLKNVEVGDVILF